MSSRPRKSRSSATVAYYRPVSLISARVENHGENYQEGDGGSFGKKIGHQ